MLWYLVFWVLFEPRLLSILNLVLWIVQNAPWMLFQIWIVTIVHIFNLLSKLLHSMLYLLETLGEISIHESIKSSLSWLIVFIACVATIYPWCLLDHSLSMGEVIICCAAHFLFLLIDDIDFLNLLWHFSRSYPQNSTTLLFSISTVWWQSCLIYLHPLMHIIWLYFL